MIQAKKFSLVVYDKDILLNGIDYLKLNKPLISYAYILHDKDINEDGNLKKIHYHLYLEFNNRLSETILRKLFNTEIVQICKNTNYYISYFIHLYDIDKYQYDKNDIIFYNLDINNILNNCYGKYKDDFQTLKELVNNIKFMTHLEAFNYVCDNNLYSLYKENYYIIRDILNYKSY